MDKQHWKTRLVVGSATVLHPEGAQLVPICNTIRSWLWTKEIPTNAVSNSYAIVCPHTDTGTSDLDLHTTVSAQILVSMWVSENKLPNLTLFTCHILGWCLVIAHLYWCCFSLISICDFLTNQCTSSIYLATGGNQRWCECCGYTALS